MRYEKFLFARVELNLGGLLFSRLREPPSPGQSNSCFGRFRALDVDLWV